jgi:hypothetical protein
VGAFFQAHFAGWTRLGASFWHLAGLQDAGSEDLIFYFAEHDVPSIFDS